MAKRFRHLTKQERDLLAVWRGQGVSLRKMASRLGRSHGTLSRELKRNAPPIRQGYYLSHKAQARADMRIQTTHRRERLGSAFVRRYVARQIVRGWSPELIAGRLRSIRPEMSVNHESIYQWIYGDARHLIGHLARSHRRRLRRGYSRRHTKAHIPGRVSIEKRPRVIDERRRFGDWEADTAVSRRSKTALQVVVERKSRYMKMKKLDRRGAHEMRVGLTRTLSRYRKSLRRSITYDNGTENTDHQETNAVLGSRSYFCNPFHSWERGTVENTIGLVRRYFPKGTDWAKVPDATIKRRERSLNNRPRKILGYKTPAEVLRLGGALRP